MLSRKFLLIMCIICAAYITGTLSTCKVCGSVSGVMCISNTQFQACIGDTVSPTIQTCPDGLGCTNTSPICIDQDAADPDCISTTQCGACNNDQRFACINSTTFAYCFGSMTPSTTAFDDCPADQYCYADATAPDYCSQSASDSTCTPPPTTTTTTTTTTAATTLPPHPTARDYCTKLNTVGRFKHPWITDCTQYVYCFLNSNTITGQYYTCQGTTIFNPSTQLCVAPGSGGFTCS